MLPVIKQTNTGLKDDLVGKGACSISLAPDPCIKVKGENATSQNCSLASSMGAVAPTCIHHTLAGIIITVLDPGGMAETVVSVMPVSKHKPSRQSSCS